VEQNCALTSVVENLQIREVEVPVRHISTLRVPGMLTKPVATTVGTAAVLESHAYKFDEADLNFQGHSSYY
jgi:hypothetical protein